MKMTRKESLDLTVLALLMSCLLLCVPAGCTTRPSTASALQRLQGTWEGAGRWQKTPGGPLVEEEGGAMNGTITITANSLHYYRDTCFWYETTFTLPAGTDPQQLHATIKNCADRESIGNVVVAIFKIEDGTLTLAMNQFDQEHPPGSFEPPKSSEEHKAMARYELRKVRLQKKSAGASTSK